MSEWIMVLIIVGSLLLLFFTGLPVAFSLVGISAILLYFFVGPQALFMMVASAANQVTQEVFIAIPLFVVMAAVLQFSGVAEDLYRAMYRWSGALRGGLAMGTVIICALIAAMSGIGATGTITMGIIAMPEMLKRGYNKHMVLGAVTAGGALGPLIPPSVLMVIVGGYAQLSVGKLFMGGLIPGLIVSAFYCIYIGIRCALRPQDGPALPLEERGTLKVKISDLRHVILPLLLIAFVMGSIFSGITTPTEAASVGALGAMVIAAIHRKLTWTNLSGAMLLSLKVTCMVMWLVIGGGCYSTLVTVSGSGKVIADAITALPFGAMGIEMVMLVIVVIMGMFMDPVAIIMICLPIFLPVIASIGADLFAMMVLFCISTIIGYITPPFGLNLFYLRGIADKQTTMKDIYRGVLPYCVLQTAVLMLCFFFPSIMTYIPNLMK
ncbi:MAG: TRAP transporter large permease subunit [Pseudomonadota bacterium]|nr:TRAP transporter large permease subunit [Pseudomonadota bacterium]